MSRPKRRRWWLVALLGLLTVRGGEPTSGQNPPSSAPRPWTAPTSLFDPRLEPLRRVSASWDSRLGPERRVVDQVCLVPDLPTFFEAIASWDRDHFFPILIDDVESSFRFIRAFKPARIVRFSKAVPPIPSDKVWERAVATVGASWASEAKAPAGDAVPKGLGPTTPGVVVSSPSAPMLAGAVALAAGRFQPLLRFDFDKRFADTLTLDEVEEFGRSFASKIRERVPNIDRLGDDCDFITVAGDWPYAYRDSKGQVSAVDDRIGRSVGSDQRWAFAGRLLGDVTESVYRAMGSLFLQPESAVMFNGYDESTPPWSDYTMRGASVRLSSVVPTSQVSGEKAANLEGWHETFDPTNRFGLVLINSHGSPTVFNIRGGPVSTADIPRSVPAAVLMIHSFSAADPNDPSTIAGRWLANGAFVFFGSMHEPFLNSFRAPRLVGDLIVERLPMVAAVRATLAEPFGEPWRLVYLGDPLYRVKGRTDAKTPRVSRWEPTASWPVYVEAAKPANGSDVDLFLWSLKTSLARLQGSTAEPGPDLVEALTAIRRRRLPTAFRPIYDALLTDVLLEAKKRTALKTAIVGIPEADRSPALRRTYETLLAIDLTATVSRSDALRARAVWHEVMKTDANQDFKKMTTDRVGRLADSAIRRADWRKLLTSTLKERPNPPDSEIIASELDRVEKAMKGDR